MQGPDTLHKLRDEPAVIPSEPNKALDLRDGGGGGPLFDNIYFFFVGCYSLGQDDVPKVCDLLME